MTLQQYKEKHEEKLAIGWAKDGIDTYANFESYCWSMWQLSEDCTYA